MHPIGYKIYSSFKLFLNMTSSEFIKNKRNNVKLTQPELAKKAGVGLRFLRDLEQGKPTLRLDKINQVLQLFGHELGPVKINHSD